MRKLLFMCLLLLASCDSQYICTDCREEAQYPKTNSWSTYWIVCIDGKEFIEGVKRLSINLDVHTGKPIPCNIKLKGDE